MKSGKEKHRLTIIIATYRRDRLLCQCIRSIERCRKRGFKDFDVIVVDDGGRCTKKARRMADPSYVRFIRMKKNGGQPAAQAAAVTLSDSELLGFLDDDATVEFDWAGEIVRYFDSYPAIGAVLGRIEPKDTSKLLARTRQVIYDKRRRKYTSREFMEEISRKYCFELFEGCTGLSDHVSGGSFAIRRRVYDAVGGLPGEVRMGCDTLFSETLLKSGFMIGYDEDMVIRHRHSTSYRVLCRNSFNEGRDYVRIKLKKGESRRSLLLPCVLNLLRSPFAITGFPEMLSAHRLYVPAYLVFTLIQFIDGAGRLYELMDQNRDKKKD